jgi:hypothetical protein
MSNPTTPFSWQMPTATDLVTDLPADFEVFGQAVATSMADLLGGTTGQILAKNSATDMDFIWTTANPGDITGVTAGTGISGGGTSGDVTVTNSMATAMTTKGDLVPATGSGAFARLGVGANDTILTADSTAATGMKWATPSTGGGMTLLSTTALSSTTTSITGISASYVNLYIVVLGANKAGAIRLNGSSSLFSGVQTWVLNTTITNTGISSGELRINAGDGLSGSNVGVAAITVGNYANTSYWKPVTQWGGFTGTSYNAPLSFIGFQRTISAISSVDIVSDSGSFTAGSVLIYGVK